MNAQQKRYVALNGDPVHMDFMDKLKCLPEYKVAGLAAAFNLCVTAVNASPQGMAMSAAGSLAGLVVAKGIVDFYDWLLLRLYYGKDFRDLAVDKEPDGNTPPTQPKYLKSANSVRDMSFLISFGMGNKWALIGLMGLYAAGESFKIPDPIDAQNFQMGMGFLGTVTSFLSTHFGCATARNHRVYKGKWAVVDMPPPQVQKQDSPVPATPQPS